MSFVRTQYLRADGCHQANENPFDCRGDWRSDFLNRFRFNKITVSDRAGVFACLFFMRKRMPVGTFDKKRRSVFVVFTRMGITAYLGKRIRRKMEKKGAGMH